jgi:GT2 family glycosyltransferase
MRSTVVFVNFGSSALIAPRARVLLEEGFEAVVVDNSHDYVGPATKVIDSGGNVGFGAACNLGIDASSSGQVIFHNPDVDVSVAVLRGLLDHLDRLERPGACAPAIRTPDGRTTFGYRYPSVRREAALAAAHAAPFAWRLATRARRSAQQPAPSDVQRFGTGALLAVDRHAFERIGGFDERIFLYTEDLDLWHRLAVGGREVRVLANLVASHARAGSSTMRGGTRELLRRAGVQYFAQKHETMSWSAIRRIHRVTVPTLRDVDARLRRVALDGWAGTGSPPWALLEEINEAAGRTPRGGE